MEKTRTGAGTPLQAMAGRCKDGGVRWGFSEYGRLKGLLEGKERKEGVRTAGQAADLPRESRNYMPLCAAVSVLNSWWSSRPTGWQ